MTNDCEIISNTACGKSFWVCRTHKVEVSEASFCPAAAKPEPGVVYKTPWAKLADYQVEINRVADAVKRREFKVGDKVRIIDPGVHTHLLNVITTIEGIDPHLFHDAPFHCDAKSERGYKVCWGQDNLEHAE